MSLDQLATPCALVDLEVVERTARRTPENAPRLGVRLRPHVKTHKCVEAARLQVQGHFGGITVSTLAEARGFFAGGFRDQTWAVPLSPARLPEACDLAEKMETLNLLLDSAEALAAVEVIARQRRRKLPVFLKVDCGYHRAGVDPALPESLALAHRLAGSPGVEFAGLLTHGGHAYGLREDGERRLVAEQERDVLVDFAARLREQGVEVPVLSVGSTPGFAATEDLTGIDEVRPGNYIFHDAMQFEAGVCAFGDLAFSVLTTVIGSHAERGRFIVDAGAIALSKDPGDGSRSFGLLRAVDGSELSADWLLASLSQEHGVVECGGSPPPSVGTRLRIFANHSCLAAAQHDTLHVLRGLEVVEEWKPLRGW
jgi:D-serine deaminase-like pyridoxal phosphate-dependent protein